MPFEREEHRYVVFDGSRTVQDFTFRERASITSDKPRQLFINYQTFDRYLQEYANANAPKSSFPSEKVFLDTLQQRKQTETRKRSFQSVNELQSTLESIANVDRPRSSFDSPTEFQIVLDARSNNRTQQKSFDSREAQDSAISRRTNNDNPKSNEEYLKGKVNSVKGKYAHSVDNFVSKLKGLGSINQSNRYWVEFTLPSGVVVGNPSTLNEVRSGAITSNQNRLTENGKLSIMCHTATMPGRGLMTVESRLNNIPKKMPYASQYDDVTFTFYATKEMPERLYFEYWQAAVFNVTDGSLNFYDEYKGRIIIHQLDTEGNSVYSVELRDAYPLSINNVDYSYHAQNEIVNVSVTFTYKYWKNRALT